MRCACTSFSSVSCVQVTVNSTWSEDWAEPLIISTARSNARGAQRIRRAVEARASLNCTKGTVSPPPFCLPSPHHFARLAHNGA